MNNFKKAIKKHIRRRLIKNRYDEEDVKSYIIERILDILQKRKAKGEDIQEPKTYFRKLIDFYCIEYQRMHGYIYGMPKRPRDPEAEQDIAQYGFVYIHDDENTSMDNIRQLGYIDVDTTIVAQYDDEYQIKGEDPGRDSTAWEKIMLMIHQEHRDILECLYKYNMSVPEAAKHLNISVSAAYSRKERGLQAISGTLCTFIDLDQDSWQIINNIEKLNDDKIDISKFFLN